MTDLQRPQSSERVRPARTTGRRTAAQWVRALGLTTALFVIMVELPGAQTWPVASLSTDVKTPTTHQQIGLLVGRSTVLTTDRPIRRVSLSTPDIADALVTTPHEVLIHGKAPGTISLLVWSDTGRISNYDVVVRRDLGALERHLTQLFPGEAISVTANGSDVVISGTVSGKYVVEQAAAVAVGYVEEPENVVNLLRQQEQEGVGSQQIMLRVRFAEVSRTALQELGASFFTDIFGSNGYVGRITTQQFAAPNFNLPNSQQFGPGSDGLVFSDFLNIVAFNNKESLGLVIRALETRGLFQSLAEPNLITQNGTEATFLAGGEYPYPILQGVTGAVTVLFKEFGIRLAFTPTIVGPDLIQLKVAPEVSALDFSNAITIEGFRVPALATRRTETQVVLRDGQTFAVAGLLDNTVTESLSKIPGLGDIPILGKLFTSRAYQKSQTELVVMITPHIVRPGSSGVASQLPDLAQPFLAPSDETVPPPPPVSLSDVELGGVAPAATVAQRSASQVPPSTGEPIPTVVTARAPEESGPVTAIATTPDPRVERTRLEAERKEAERTRKAEAELAREEAKRAAEAAKRAAEEAKRAAKAEKARLDVERKQAEETRKAEAKLAREEAKRAAEEAKRADEEAKRAAKAEETRLDVERKQAEETRKAEAKLAREEAKRAAEEATRVAKAEQKRVEAERKQAEQARKKDEKLAKERAKRQAELDRILAEFQTKLDHAQRAVDEIDRERQRLPEQSGLVVPLNGWPEPDSGRSR